MQYTVRIRKPDKTCFRIVKLWLNVSFSNGIWISSIHAHTCKSWISPVSDRTYLNVLDMMNSPEKGDSSGHLPNWAQLSIAELFDLNILDLEWMLTFRTCLRSTIHSWSNMKYCRNWWHLWDNVFKKSEIQIFWGKQNFSGHSKSESWTVRLTLIFLKLKFEFHF